MSDQRTKHPDPILLFDLGGVLVENTGFEALRDLLPGKTDPTILRERWLTSPSVRRFERGQITPDAFAAAFLDEWRLELSPRDFLMAFTAWPKGFYAGAEALLGRLRATYRVMCLSNSNALHWDRFGGFKNHFDTAYSSHLLGKIKPDPDVFIAVMADMNAVPDQIYFFDDSLSNIRAAQDVGLRAFHVEGIGDVERALMEEMLL